MMSVFKNINRHAGKSKILDWFAIFCAKYLLYVMAVALFLVAIEYHSRGIFFYSLSAGLSAAFVINTVIYSFYKRERPAELRGTRLLIPIPSNPSFPSRHAAFTSGISFYLFFYNVPIAIIFLVCSFFVGISRVFCGVHWFSDILGGIISGLISYFVIYYLVLLIR